MAKTDARVTGLDILPRWSLICIGAAAALIGVLVAWSAAVTSVAFLTLCACLLAWKKPAAVISGLAFYIPLERFVTVRLPDTAFILSQASGEIVLLALLAGILLKRTVRGRHFVSTPIDLALVVFVGICLLSALINGVGLSSTAYGVRILLRYAIVFYAIVNAGFTRRQLRFIFAAYVAAMGIQIAAGLVQVLSGGSAKEWFIASREVAIGDVTFAKGQREGGTGLGLFTVIFGTLDSYNDYGMFLALAWLTAYALSRERHGFYEKGQLRLLLLLGFACVVLSFSRSSLLAVVIGLTTISYVRGNRALAWTTAVVLIVGLGAIAVLGAEYSGQYLPVRTTNLLYRWVRPFVPENLALTQAGNYRLFLALVVSVRVLAQSPVFGLGPGTFASALTLSAGSALYENLGMSPERAALYAADSNWTTVLVQTGLVGLVAFLFIMFGMAGFSGRAFRTTSDPTLRGACLAQISATTALVVAGFFGPFFEARYTSFYYWVLGGIVVALARAEGMPSGRGTLRRLLASHDRTRGPSSARSTFY